MLHNSAILTMADQYDLLNGVIFNDLEPGFQGKPMPLFDAEYFRSGTMEY